MNKTDKLHYSWMIVFVGFLLTFFVMALNSAIYGLMIVPICDEFGITRAEFSLSRTFGSISSMLVAMVVGELYQKFTLKKTVMTALAVIPVCFVVQGLTPNIAVFHVMAFIFGAAVTLTTSIAISTLINNWFAEKSGFALSIAVLGSGFGGLVMNPLIGALITKFGWRNTFLVLALLVAILLIPLIGILLKEKPSDMGLQPYGYQMQESDDGTSIYQDALTGMTVGQAAKTPMFACMAIVCAVAFGASNCFVLHTVAYATDLGFDYNTATLAATVLTAGTMISKPIMGKVYDRFGSQKASTMSLVMFAVTSILYFVSGNNILIFMGALVFGFGSCFANLAPTLITQDIFGRKHFASICAKWQMFGALGSAVLSPFVGAIYDRYGSYKPAWIMLACIMIVCIVLIQLMFKLNRNRAAESEIH